MEKPQTFFTARNPHTRLIEYVDPELGEWIEGQRILKVYATAQGHVTIPGDSVYERRNGEWVCIDSEEEAE